MPQQDEHEFMVAGVELAAGEMIDGIAIMLIDARGGKARLNLSTDMAELLVVAAVINACRGVIGSPKIVFSCESPQFLAARRGRCEKG